MLERAPVLRARGLCVTYHGRRGDVCAVDDVDFELREGEMLGLAGESGCGKSSLALSILGLLPPASACTITGTIQFGDRELTRLSERDWCAVRGREIGAVFQDALASLDPRLTIGDQIARAAERAGRVRGRAAARVRALELCAAVELADPAAATNAFPHELSGGMRQRALLAHALAGEPRVLVLDEPTTALDRHVARALLSRIDDLRRERGTAVLLVTHDLAAVRDHAQRCAVMYAGRIVEMGCADDVFARPRHPYTQGLLRCAPFLSTRGARIRPIDGSPPALSARSIGCAFQPRCEHARDDCLRLVPELDDVEGRNRVACHHPLDRSGA